MNLFQEIKNGYGFKEVEQTQQGNFCNGCLKVHKRPTKLYTDGRETYCKFQLIYHYQSEFQSN